MSTRLVLIDYVLPIYDAKRGDTCSGQCPRFSQGKCQHFGELKLRPKRKRTYERHPLCIRAEGRTGHASISRMMLRPDFDDE